MPSYNKKCERSLFRWLHLQKRDYLKGDMLLYRVELLEGINGWRWIKSKPERWMGRYKELKEYVLKYISYPTEDENKRIAHWIPEQRCVMRGERGHMLNSSQISLLESLPQWSWDGWEQFNKRWFDSRQKTYKLFKIKEFISLLHAVEQFSFVNLSLKYNIPCRRFHRIYLWWLDKRCKHCKRCKRCKYLSTKVNNLYADVLDKIVNDFKTRNKVIKRKVKFCERESKRLGITVENYESRCKRYHKKEIMDRELQEVAE